MNTTQSITIREVLNAMRDGARVYAWDRNRERKVEIDPEIAGAAFSVWPEHYRAHVTVDPEGDFTLTGSRGSMGSIYASPLRDPAA